MFIYLIILAMLAADLWWWWVSDRIARRAGRAWRIAVNVFMAMTVLGLLLLVISRPLRIQGMIMPEQGVVLVFVWHFLLLPLVTIPSVLASAGRAIWRTVRPPTASATVSNPGRRAFLAQIVVAAPPVLTLGVVGKTMVDADDLIVRRTDLLLKQLPRALDGATIAFISDPHVGSFMSDRKFNEIIRLTNELDADLVLHAGDLINASLRDLPDGINLLRRMAGRYGVYSCQGNHDCIENRGIFERDTTRSGIHMLLDEVRPLMVRRHKVDILAPRWSARTDAGINAAVQRLLPYRGDNAFAILLAHHPHSFDAAAGAAIPLTLAGHTHGGQLALTRNIGIGPLMYRYWSGEYRLDQSAAIISNGVGNWFPLRVNVPCEIIHITLRTA